MRLTDLQLRRFHDDGLRILMRTSRDPEYRIDWTAWARKNRVADAMDQKPVDPFDATVTGPWLYRWASTGD